MLLSLALLALLASAQGRAVNISNTWVLPEEGFPVFYRYFRDRISWYEADAVCQFHHANLVTVDTTAQYDAVRAYLKELDISSAVWVGLIRSNPDGDFTWTDYRGLSGEGYWSAAPDGGSAPLCAAADPAADYRWEARPCGGPTVASFICELPVPQWALGNEGCMVRALPALTILYLPESAAVQLTTDCGMAGVKKVQCTGNVKRDDLLKELACANEEELSTAMSTGLNWPVTSDLPFTDQDTINEATTEEVNTTEHEVDINQPLDITATSLPQFIYPKTQNKATTKLDSFNKLNNVYLSKNINLEENHDHNLQSNVIPKKVEEDNILTSDQLEKLEDERHKQHKMLHEEIARVGNVGNIFNQPTDHFIPPLVMAKAKISDDMTVLSLAQKHAQQLADKQFSKQKFNNAVFDHSYLHNNGRILNEDKEKPLISTIKPIKWKDSKKEILKNHSPKKYMNEKYNDVKIKTRLAEPKTANMLYKLAPTPLALTSTETTTKETETLITSEKTYAKNITKSDVADDFGIDLTVILKDAALTSEEQPSFAGDVANLETIQNNKINHTVNINNAEKDLNDHINVTNAPETIKTENFSDHKIIQITIVADEPVSNTTVIEVTTRLPVFKDSFQNITTASLLKTQSKEFNNYENLPTSYQENNTEIIVENVTSIVPVTHIVSTTGTSTEIKSLTTVQSLFSSTETITSTELITTAASYVYNKTEHPFEAMNITATTLLPTKAVELDLNSTTFKEDAKNISSTEYHEMLLNMTHHKQNEDDEVDDFRSPLFSGVMEPAPRPPRTRRPQQPNRNKFNPFRILG